MALTSRVLADRMTVFYSLYIVNKAGSLAYAKDFSQAAQLEMNKKLELASTFHGLHAIACNIAPVKSSGIEAVECDTFKLFCLQTPTGVKFLLVTEPAAINQESVLHSIYELYCDYVLKNPFYQEEAFLSFDLFDSNLERLIHERS